MDRQPATHRASSDENNALRIGFLAAALTSILTLITFGIAFNTPPLSGPFCIGEAYRYPYLDIASRFPRDYYWMYPALVLMIVYVVLVICIHEYAAKENKVYSLIGLAFAFMSAGIIFVDYFLQLSIIQPSLVQGETDGISILSQYNPHGIFIALEDLGYLLMSFAFVFFASVFSRANRAEKTLRLLFRLNFLLAIGSLIYISALYGIHREYRFEVAVISFNWLTMIISGILLSFIFRRRIKQSKQ